MTHKFITILHTNDIHSDLTHWQAIQNFLLSRRHQLEEAGHFVLAFDTGDLSDRAHPLVEATEGQAFIPLLNRAKIDAITIGNNEGVTYSHDALSQMYQHADFEVLVANLFDGQSGKYPSWLKAYKIYEVQPNIKIGVFGLTVDLVSSYQNLGWKIENPLEAAEKFYEAYADQADYWILLSHLGIDVDQEIAACVPIDLIIGGHTHHALEEGMVVQDSLLTGAGQFGEFVGEITIIYDADTDTFESRAQLHQSAVLPHSNTDQNFKEEMLARGHEMLSADIVGQLSSNYDSSWAEDSQMSALLLDAIIWETGAEIGLVNAGMILDGLSKGKVTKDDLHKILPHPIYTMSVWLSGSDLIEIYEYLKTIQPKLLSRRMKGFGFRGKEFGKFCWQGLERYHGKYYILSEPIDLERIYHLGTVEYFSFYPFMSHLYQNEQSKVHFPKFLRHVLADYLLKS